MTTITLEDALKADASIDIGDATHLKFGGTSDYTEIKKSDGTMRLRGAASTWTDMIGDLFGKRLASTAGKVTYDYDENAMVFSPSGSISNENDRVGANLEINHNYAVGASIIFNPHIHWFQDVVSGVVKPFILTMRYRLQRNNVAKTTAWTTVTCEVGAGGDDIFDFTGESDGLYNQLSRFPDITVTCSVSDTIQFQVARTDGETTDMPIYFMDMHGKIDSLGSNDEIAKEA